MAGREGGGGDMGKSHSNSEEEHTKTYGRPVTNGFRPPKILIMLRHYTCSYMWINDFFCIYLVFLCFFLR